MAVVTDTTLAGVALFENPSRPDEGWAAVGGEPARRIASAQDLSSGVVWLTNLDYNDFRNTGLKGSQRFRSRDYLRTNLASISAEFGMSKVNPQGQRVLSGRECATKLALFFDTVMKVSWRMGLQNDVFPPYSLRYGFREALWPRQPERLPDEVAQPIANACQAFTFSERRRAVPAGNTRETLHHLYIHRPNHARQVLSQPVPCGPWRSIKMMSHREIVEHPKPLLIKAEVRDSDAEVGSMINFGGLSVRRVASASGQMVSDARPREWLPQPEFAFLSQHAHISVNRILEADRYAPNPLLPVISAYSKLHSLSPAFQVVAESLWSGPLRSRTNTQDLSADAAWILAYDRIACVEKAIKLVRRDTTIDVSGFGYGRISIRHPDKGANTGNWFVRLLADTDLVPPMQVHQREIRAPEPAPDDIAGYFRTIVLVTPDDSIFAELDADGIADWDKHFPMGLQAA